MRADHVKEAAEAQREPDLRCSPVSPAEGEVEIARRLGSLADDYSDEYGEPLGLLAMQAASDALDEITRLREQRDDLVGALRDTLALPPALAELAKYDDYIRSGAKPLPFGVVLAKARALIAELNADTSGLSSRRDEMVTPSAEAASAIAPKITGAMGE